MESWFLYAVLSAIFVWIHKFINKVVANKWINKNNFLLYSWIMQLLVTFIYLLYTWSYFYMTFIFWILIILRTVFVNEKYLTMIESLKYIDSSLFFPSNKIIQIFGSFIVWIFLFKEFLWIHEILFIIFWLISILFLSYKKEKIKNKDLKKWIIFMIFSSLFLIWTTTINKYIWVNENISLYMFLCSIWSILYILFRIKISKEKFVFNKEELFYWNILWIIWFLWFTFYLNSMTEWKLVVVQLISIISILIPIILSYIFLKEEINRYRIIWLILFLFNLWIFYLNK